MSLSDDEDSQISCLSEINTEYLEKMIEYKIIARNYNLFKWILITLFLLLIVNNIELFFRNWE
jgi:hypothetical protein